MLRRSRLAAVAALAAIAALIYSLTAPAATPIPVPDAIVVVTTKSGPVTKTHMVPIGGAPIPIDVDGPSLTGVLEPDIDVSVGLVALDELPDKPVVPNVVVTRNALAVVSDRPAPPVDLDAKIVLRDAANGLKPLVEVHYGFETPAGARMPPKISAKLLGPIQGGFIDPLIAKLETPGYSGPLDLKISALTEDLDARFRLDFDAMPEEILINEDPREDGLDVTYDHKAPVADVHLKAKASLRDRSSNELLQVGAEIERLPQHIELHNTNVDGSTEVTYASSSAFSKPDMEATYRDLDGQGGVVTDANVKVAGLPFGMEGKIETVVEDGEDKIDKVDFKVTSGDEIGGVDFVARNFDGPAGTVPAPNLAPDQYVAVGSRFVDGATRWRAAGRLLGIRSAVVERQGDDNDILDARTDIGDGARPLRALLDVDNRPDPSVADDKDMRLKIDTTIAPLPERLHVVYEPSNAPDDPLRLLYESSRTMDVDASAIIAEGAADGCGQAEVLCADARVDKVPSRLEAKLPGTGGTDFSIDHDGGGTQRPDVRATVDATNEDSERAWADVRILRVPNKVSGRLDTSNGVLKKAEFHGCEFDYEAIACTDPSTADALGRVTFTVRDRPDRTGLPARPDVAAQYVTLLKRDDRFEAAGSVDEVRNVVFHQRDDNADGDADGTLGAKVDVGNGGAFDVVVDDVSDFADPDDTTEPITILGKGETKMRIGIESLPTEFSACVRENAETAPPSPGSLSPDPLLAECDRVDILKRQPGQLEVTPLSAFYTASQPTKVSAKIESEAPDKEDPISGNSAPYHRSKSVFSTVIQKVPDEIRADVISPVTPEPDKNPPVAGRKLELDYDASERIDRIDFGMESRRATSLCEDPRPNRRATCLSAVLTDLPDDIFVSFDPDDSKGDIHFITAPPASGDPRLSINKDLPTIPEPMRLSVVNPGEDDQPLLLDARITDIADRLEGKLISKDVDGEGGLGPSKCSNGVDDDSDSSDSGGGTDAADDDCEKDMAAIQFNASCPESACDGIGDIRFTATNSLVGDPLPEPDPATTTIPGVTQDFSFIQREELFRARGHITKLKELGLSQLDDAQNPSATTRINAAFGTGLPTEKIRAYIDTDSGAEQLIADAVISQAPSGINLCLRDGIPSGSDFAPVGNSPIYCDTAPSDQLAMQVSLDEPAGAAKPDIDLRRLRVASGGGNSLITGDAQIDDLGERIDVLVGRQAKDGDILVEGQKLDDDNTVPVESDPDNVAGRVTFNLRNRETLPGGQFPWESLENLDTPGSTVDVEAEGDNNGNYVKFLTDADGRFLARGSVPDIKRLAKRAGTCFADARFPALDQYGALNRPEYSCLQANVAGDKPLGLAVRTIDDKNEILEVEEGHITQVPSGGLSITMAKSPEAAGLDPVCTDPATDFPCRPPMLSMEAPRSDLNVVPSLRARLSTGSKELVETVREQEADDTLSDNLDYERPPKEFEEPGARVKVGTGEGDALAIRMNANLPLRQFLDLDQPTIFSCVHTVKQPDPLTQCEEEGVGTDENEGYESKDIFFKLVAADDHHDGSDVDSIGRVAVLVQDYKKDGTQTVITGTPDPDNNSWFKDFGEEQHNGTFTPTADPVDGASSYFPENLPSDTDPSNRGFLVPGHLDVKVFLRNDYNAVEDGKKQQSYAQVDGRINRPLSLAVRLNDGLKENRDGDPVAPVQLTIRNATSSNGQDSYVDPTFRVRSELKKDWVDTSGINFGEAIYTCDGQGYGIDLLGFVTLCLVLPVNTDAQWLDVGMNMDPNMSNNTTSDNAARTVDAVAGPFGGENDADLRGFDAVNANSGTFGKGNPARFVPQAGLRLKNFNLGLKVGAGIGLVSASTSWVEEGDLVVGLTGHQPTRTRLDHNLLVMRLSGGTEAHPNRINTNMQSTIRFKVTAEALFGLVEGDVINETIGDFHHNIVFRDCVGDFLPLGFNNDEFLAPANGFLTSNKTAIAFGDTDDLFGDLATKFNNLLTTVADGIFCLFSTDDSEDVNPNHPAPSYTINSRKVDNGPGDADAPAGGGATPPSDDTARKDLTISAATPVAERTRCGTIEARKLTIDAGVTLRVGREGEVDGISGGQCTGALNLEVDELVVNGTIDADGARTITAGPGAGHAPGGGAGHHGIGGNSGGGGSGGSPRPLDTTAPAVDFGSAGANGSGGILGGRGGGTVRIASVAEVTVNGAIRARGTDGTTTHTDCPNVAGGGGSGGAVEITATRVGGSGEISVDGGDGGTGPRGGGGGSGGRITVNAVVRGSHLLSAFPGGGGFGLEDCGPPDDPDHGTPGGTGTTSLGTTLDRAAGVFLHPDTPGPFVKGSGKLIVKGIQQVQGGDPDAGPMDIVVCRRYLNPDDTTGGFEDPALDPGPSATLSSLLDGSDNCHVQEFTAPNVGTDRYQRTITVPLVPPFATGDGFYSWYAFAAKRPDVPIVGDPGDSYCDDTHGGGIFDPECDYQSVAGSTGETDVLIPRQAPTRLGSDTTAPVYGTSAGPTPDAQRPRNGFAGCPDDSLCLPEAQGKIRIEAFDRTAGIKNVTCTVTGGPADTQNCTPAPSISLNLGASDGLKEANVRMEDAADDLPADPAGNVANYNGVVKWFRDTTKPNQPSITLNPPTCAGQNGWCTDFPAISATATDGNPSSGFTDGSLSILVDESGVECGSAADGSSDTSGSTLITCPEGVVNVTTEGRHVISAVAKDRLGNESPRAANHTIKVDKTAPTVEMALGPKKPDGLDADGEPSGWYVTNPFMAFAASDKAGGSKVDPDIAPSGIFYEVDGVGGFQKFDPEADLRLGDGVHEVCFYAVDVAGNQSATKCRSDIKVDTQEPDIDDPVTPAVPDGDNGFYRVTPTIDPDANDPVPTGVNQVSDIQRTELSVDDGPWVPAVPTDIAEGEHTVRSRAFDKAGNPSTMLEQTIYVDKSDPSARLVTFPPLPNTRQWFRRHVSESIAAYDGRDGSGADSATYTVDGLPGPTSYLGPFTVTDGVRSVGFRARDFAGRQGVEEKRTQKIDTLIPFGAPTGKAQNILLQLLGLPKATTLSFTAGDQLSDGRVKVQVLVYNSLLGLVRVLDVPGPYQDGYRDAGAGSVQWNGLDSDGAGALPGAYHYRVRVIDQAGNTVLSDESPIFLVVQGLLPLPGLKLL